MSFIVLVVSSVVSYLGIPGADSSVARLFSSILKAGNANRSKLPEQQWRSPKDPLSVEAANLQDPPKGRPPTVAMLHWSSNYATATNRDLVAQLAARNLLKSPLVHEAMSTVDRANFVPEQQLRHAYEDRPLPIGFGATISAPHMHTICLELLVDYLQPGTAALDIGSGSGYFTALMAAVMARGAQVPKGKVVGVEHVEELVSWSKDNVAKQKDPVLDQLVVLKAGDGRKGDVDHSPYMAIHVGAATQGLPQALLDQLAVGGRMVLPVAEGLGMQYLTVVDKLGPGKDDVRVSKRLGVTYVPLTDRSYYEP